ncbi:hypothetical protein DOK67_0001098 [Enterococcus sp. DIV0212c]|uniref:hypothetical protein n=1 Tax=Enterococcus sp. DIV0212c TaxID=2230867 RepID=UPI001A9B59C1|nr:hypothetical protein [Enterococcus sp. DIV0212c]MBO1354456.1 hypothetical protein [Enterococcus sp. DIV0212c]
MQYIWLYILGGACVLLLFLFFLNLATNVSLVKKLNLKRKNLILDGSLLMCSLVSGGLFIYLFLILKDQLNVLTNNF